MIHTDEDDEFDRIERESKMKGQPYHWEADAIKAAVLIEREECARLCETFNLPLIAEAIREKGTT